jgi:alpha-L-arabinofuranosidase
MKRLSVVSAIVASVFCLEAQAQPKAIEVNVTKVTAQVQPTMWGVFFEDINMGADGGIYAEMVKNRSFEFFRPLMGWTVKQPNEGDVLILNRKEENSSNPRFARINVRNPKRGEVALLNEGFRGMGLKKGLRYDFSVMYRQQTNGIKLHIELLDERGQVTGETVLLPALTGKQWHKQSVSLHASVTDPKGKMNIWFEGKGVIDLDMISLFPSDTWKNRPGGLRADMVQMLADMKPGFIRFPGGCIVEGFDLSQRYQWKKTIGPVENRQLLINRWNFEFAHRPTPDYFQTFGLGFFEYFQLCEDIGAQPLPIINCGMACQFNSAEVVPLDELGPYVQDALDLVEFANGDASTKWGKVRAGMGHPAPFHMKMMGVGNENWGPQYLERLALFTKAIKAKYPDIKLVNSSGTDPVGERFDYLNTALRKSNADLIDEHYYRRPEWFLQNAGRYDNYPRTGSKVFAGEYAAQSDKTVSVDNRNNLLTALSEAAFMTGLERNADVVNMASYAPLFAHAEGWQWTPDLIWVDNLETLATPDYYVQKLFSVNKGTKVVSVTANNQVIEGQDSLYASAVVDDKTKELIVKLVNVSGKPLPASLFLKGVSSLPEEAKISVLGGADVNAVNTFDKPSVVAPKESVVAVKGNTLSMDVQPYSLSVLEFKMN